MGRPADEDDPDGQTPMKQSIGLVAPVVRDSMKCGCLKSRPSRQPSGDAGRLGCLALVIDQAVLAVQAHFIAGNKRKDLRPSGSALQEIEHLERDLEA